jgi:hypothetical protein
MTIVATVPVAGDPLRRNVFFSPADLAPMLWWDARIAQSVGPGWWRDEIAGAVASQATGAAQPGWDADAIGGATAGLTFDGTDDRLLMQPAPGMLPDGAEPGWLFAVVQQDASGDATPDNRFILAYGDNVPSRSFGRRDSGGVNRSYVQSADDGAGTTTASTGTAAVFSGPAVLFAQYTGTAMQVWCNGLAEPSVTATLATPLNRLRIGANSNGGAGGFWKGAIGQIVIGAGTLATADRQALEGWGARLFDAPSILPLGHPRRDGSLF